MGNDQSSIEKDKEMKIAGRRSLDATVLRQVKSAQSTPRISLAGPRLIHKTSEASLDVSPGLKAHRLSVGDCRAPPERRLSRGKLSISGEMGNQQTKRISRAAIHFGETGDFGLTLTEQLKLTAYQTQLVQSTWQKIKGNNQIFTQIFKLLCFKSTVAREIFQKLSIMEGFKADGGCDLNMHAKVLSDLIDSIVTDLGQPVKVIQTRCMEIGSTHNAMTEKSSGAIWECLGECMSESITKIDCVRSKREAVKGWISIISFVVDSMKGGYTDEFRRKHVQRGSVTHLNGSEKEG